MRHERTQMVYAGRSNAKHRQGNGYRNHWFNVYQCPTCKRRTSHKRLPVFCSGTDDAALRPEGEAT